MENKYYVYRHIRLDKNEVFYVGIGTKPKKFSTVEGEYSRAYNKNKISRSKHWHNIIKKTGFIVEIIYEANNYENIKLKEKEFIKMYGRIDLKTGTLVNFTDGGDGTVNWNPSEITRKRMSESQKKLMNFGENSHTHKCVYVYNIFGNFIDKYCSIRNMCKLLGLEPNSVTRQLQKKSVHHKGYRFFEDYLGEKIQDVSNYNPRSKVLIPVYQLNNSRQIIAEHISISEAARNVNSSAGNITRACKNNTKSKGFYWKYKSQETVE